MKFSCEVEINIPRSKVIELFDDPDNMPKWQPHLIRFKPISGNPGHPNAKSRLTYSSGKGEFELIETVTDRNLPDEFSGTYESKLGFTRIRNRFLDQGTSTRWIVDTEFVGSGIMKILSWFMGGAIRKQTSKVVQAFKAFAEAQAGSDAARK